MDGVSKSDEQFRAWFVQRYGVGPHDDRPLRLVPMDLREAWRAARRFDDATKQLLLQSLRQSAEHTYPESEAEYEALISDLGLEP